MKTKKETSSGGIVFKKENGHILWLITQHSQHKGWSFPKGLIGDAQINEPMENAALREVEEEGGVKAQIIHSKPVPVSYEYKWKGSPHGKDAIEEFLVKKKVYYYLMEYISGDPKNHDWEMMDAKFVSEKEIKKMLTFPADKKAFEEILYFFNSLK